MKTFKHIISVAVSLLFSISLLAQETDSSLTRPFQISFIYPMGTNGIDSYKYTNNVSINILSGISGGVDGVEAGGMLNVTKGNVKGVQVSGFANLNKGNLQGGQGAGFVNVQHGYAQGIQGAGFINYNHKHLQGGQGAGFMNVSLDSVHGVQGAGFYNHAQGNVKGVQGAGFANLAIGSVTGVQGSGFANIAVGNVTGGQGAGFSNIATDTVNGLQASGFFNYAKHVKGFQVGFINYCDSIENGLPIGFLSIVKNGYHHLEVEANETMHANLALKLGVERFYNIFSLHARPTKDSLVWGFGYGIGTNVPISNKWGVNFDLQSAHLNLNNVFTDKVNLLNTMKFHANYKIMNRLTVYGGPNINVLVRDNDLNSSLQYQMYSWEENDYTTDLNVGLSIGLRF